MQSKAQKQVKDRWSSDTDIVTGRRLGSTHFREYNNDGEAWTGKGVRGCNEEWEDDSQFV